MEPTALRCHFCRQLARIPRFADSSKHTPPTCAQCRHDRFEAATAQRSQRTPRGPRSCCGARVSHWVWCGASGSVKEAPILTKRLRAPQPTCRLLVIYRMSRACCAWRGRGTALHAKGLPPAPQGSTVLGLVGQPLARHLANLPKETHAHTHAQTCLQVSATTTTTSIATSAAAGAVHLLALPLPS